MRQDDVEEQLKNSATPIWMSPKNQMEQPEWALRDEVNPGAREHIIPIMMEQTPTPTKTPASPGFPNQPYYNPQQQYANMQSPIMGFSNQGKIIKLINNDFWFVD